MGWGGEGEECMRPAYTSAIHGLQGGRDEDEDEEEEKDEMSFVLEVISSRSNLLRMLEPSPPVASWLMFTSSSPPLLPGVGGWHSR
jgi:hypothetical protein